MTCILQPGSNIAIFSHHTPHAPSVRQHGRSGEFNTGLTNCAADLQLCHRKRTVNLQIDLTRQVADQAAHNVTFPKAILVEQGTWVL